MKTTIIVLVSLLGAISIARAGDQDVTARNIAVVRAQTDSLNRGDIDAAVADFAEDVSNFGKSRGHSGMRSVLEDLADVPRLSLRDPRHYRRGRFSRGALQGHSYP